MLIFKGCLGTEGLGQMKRRGSALQRESAFRRARFAMPIFAAVAAAGLSGCASISEKFADSASRMPVIGLPADAPQRPSTPPVYPAVHDIPPPRNSVVLTNTEATQLENDLAAARDQQQTAAGGTPYSKKNPKPPAKVVPVSSSASIY
jgi:hypothetical protein